MKQFLQTTLLKYGISAVYGLLLAIDFVFLGFYSSLLTLEFSAIEPVSPLKEIM